MLVGHVATTPALRSTAAGARTTFRIAVNGYKGRKDFFSVVAWGDLAETVARAFFTGQNIKVEGRLQARSWEAQDGTKRYTVEVVATDVQNLTVSSPAAESA